MDSSSANTFTFNGSILSGSSYYDDLAEGHTSGLHEFGLVGDYYVEPDDVCRGVTLPEASALYRGDDTFKIDAEPIASNMFFSSELSDPLLHDLGRQSAEQDHNCLRRSDEFSLVFDKSPHMKFQSHANTPAPLSSPDFSCVGKPCEVPFGGASCTSVNLGEVCATEAMKALHEFFTSASSSSSASVKKLRLEKCWLSANVVIHEVHHLSFCSAKARLLYMSDSQRVANEPQQLMIELQRQDADGESMAFIEVFKSLSTFLEARFGVSSQAAPEEVHSESRSASEYEDMCTLKNTMDTTDLSTSLQPLHDAMHMSTSPANQAEALAAMAVIASMDAVSVCAALIGSQALLASLIMSSSPAIAYPATYLAQQIVRFEKYNAECMLQTALERSPFRHLIC